MDSRQKLIHAIDKWNTSRVPLFTISEPTQNLDFNGVVRFFHQDGVNDNKYVTKCVRVTSSANTLDVISTLSEKFRGDMRMLTKPKYALYEVHEGEPLRKLEDDENPLFVQLQWIDDDREGRFLLMNENDLNHVKSYQGMYGEEDQTMRKAYKAKKKKTKKKDSSKRQHMTAGVDNNDDLVQDGSHETAEVKAARNLYNEVPESTFTRTVSNPEAVMKKRREQKLQKRGAEMVKIYAHGISPVNPYKTILLLPTDQVEEVIRQALEKYRLGKENPNDYNLYQIVLPPGSIPEECLDRDWGNERLLGVDDMPLAIKKGWQPHQGTLMFQLRHKSESRNPATAPSITTSEQQQGNNNITTTVMKSTSNQQQVSNERRPEHSEVSSNSNNTTTGAGCHDNNDASSNHGNHNKQQRVRRNSSVMMERGGSSHVSAQNLPKFIELCLGEQLYTHEISENVNEVGFDYHQASYSTYIELKKSPNLHASHCIVTYYGGSTTITPHDNCVTVVRGKQIHDTTILYHSDALCLGLRKALIYCAPNQTVQWEQINSLMTNLTNQAAAQQQRKKQQMRNNEDKLTSGGIVRPHQQHYRANRPLSQQPASSTSQLHHNAVYQQHNNNVRSGHHNQHIKHTLERKCTSVISLSTVTTTTSGNTSGNTDSMRSIDTTPRPFPYCLLPCQLQMFPQREIIFLHRIMLTSPRTLHFQLSPAYTLYLILRSMLNDYQSSQIITYCENVSTSFNHNITAGANSIYDLSFWMANISELLNFMRQDQHLYPITSNIQAGFANNVQLAFRHLVGCMQKELYELMPAFLVDNDDDMPINGMNELRKQNELTTMPTMWKILQMLGRSMSILRRSRVNAALTIQLFSQLFHSINRWLFNRLIDTPHSRMLCCRIWGVRIRRRIALVENWAEQQGLDLAAECHLARIIQATTLLTARKVTNDDIISICGSCFKLNSLQLHALLTNYQPDMDINEQHVSHLLIDRVVNAAKLQADEITKSDGLSVKLLEDPDLHLPFLFPEDGYSCDVINGIPSGLEDFLLNLQRESMCSFKKTTPPQKSWTVYFSNQSNNTTQKIVVNTTTPSGVEMDKEGSSSNKIKQSSQPQFGISRHNCHLLAQVLKPEILDVNFQKINGGLGLSIVAAKDENEEFGTYVRAVVPDGAAHLDGRLQSGDELLSVDGNMLNKLTQSEAADKMKKTKDLVRLKVSKHSAIFRGLNTIIDPSMIKFIKDPPNYPNIGITTNQQRRIKRQQAAAARKWPDQRSDLHRSHVYINQPSTQPSSNNQPPSFTQSSIDLRYDVRPDNNPAPPPDKPLTFEEAKRKYNMRKKNQQQSTQPAVSVAVPPQQAVTTSSKSNINDGPNNLMQPGLIYETTLITASPSTSSNDLPTTTSNNTNNIMTSQRPQSAHIKSSASSQRRSPPTSQQHLRTAIDNPNYEKVSIQPPPPPIMTSQYNDYMSTMNSETTNFTTSTGTTDDSDTNSWYLPSASTLQQHEYPDDDDDIVDDDLQQKIEDRVGRLTIPIAAVKPTRMEIDDTISTNNKSSPTSISNSTSSNNQRRSSKKKTSYPRQKVESKTLPREFKQKTSTTTTTNMIPSTGGWNTTEQERLVQEQLNAERDEEIIELQRRINKLSGHEKERLKTLLAQQKFYEEFLDTKRNKFSDETTSNEDFEVPDRPDRDRLIKIQQDSTTSLQSQQSNNNNNNNNNNDAFKQAVASKPLDTDKPPALSATRQLTNKVPLRRDSSGRSSNNDMRPISDGYMLRSSQHKIRSPSGQVVSPNKDTRSARERLFSSNTAASGQTARSTRTSSTSSRPLDPSIMSFKDRQKLFQGK